ncbi:spermidine synthase [Paracidovorax avenae]|uniref:spermidine synthase n=1 Tax=Paracidovorax avenae TaxID=80867 RepID=UPI00126034DD|nr:fused MFS/spermidine synthase [Paracidovorax avenae]
MEAGQLQVLMGATLPLVFQCLRGMGIPTGRAIAPLYGANVLGAAVGALIAGYALLPAVGRNGATFLAAVISLLVALFVIDKIKRGATAIENSAGTAASRSDGDSTAQSVVDSHQGVGALAVLLLGGAVTLALEIVFMHLLAVVAGNSVYAFGLMLATFLLGLGLGSTVGERLMLIAERSRLIIWSQCGIVLSILLTSFVWDGLANYMGSFSYAEKNGIYLDFAGREMVRALVCALAMMPPAIFIGISYPASMGLAADWLGRSGKVARGVGIASGVNTLGNIAGVLLAGFWLLPEFGSRNVLFGLALLALILACMMIVLSSRGGGRTVVHWAVVAILAVMLTGFPDRWNYTALSQGSNVYFHPQQWGEVIDHAESMEGGLTTVARSPDGLLTLLTNGKFQGNNSEAGEMVAQESFALIPLLHTGQRDRALVIGYGTGMTARVLNDQGFDRQDVVELSHDIVSMADKHFRNINSAISNHPTVHMHYTDGRNYLLTQSDKFDLISLEITSIWFAGAANLYNREFYELANKRLLSQGVLQQWVQLHHMRPIDFLYILGSVRSVFKNVWIYVSGGQGIIVASNGEASINNSAAVQKLLAGHTISNIDVKKLPSTLVASPEEVNALIRRYDASMSFFVSTDKNLYLEYATPKGNAIRDDTQAILIGMLKGVR